ncbi:MAG: glycosyltransferase family 2 protein [Lachnospiraceae bacterium]|nr:glycosyltransferase family 2 protein [Lachnospiraceae bacterium]
MIKISIVIPVYNVEKYLDLCIRSVLAQEYENYEVILVDDGSTDHSPQICDRYAEQDARIRVVHQSNGGLSCARNTGVKHATGDYVFFLDSDDCIHPQLLSRVGKLAEEYKAPLIQIDIESVPHDFQDYQKEIEKDYPVYQFDTIDAFYNLDRDDQKIAKDIRLITTVAWTKLYRKDLVDNIPFPEDIRLHEDQMVAHRFIVEAGGILFYRAPLYYYRNRPNSLITEGWTTKRLTILDCYKDRVEWTKKISGDIYEIQNLTYYIFIRYLTCMFKNYWMATRKLQGEEKEKIQQMIIKRYRQELKTSGMKLKPKDWIVFHLFGLIPKQFVAAYQIIQKIK